MSVSLLGKLALEQLRLIRDSPAPLSGVDHRQVVLGLEIRLIETRVDPVRLIRVQIGVHVPALTRATDHYASLLLFIVLIGVVHSHNVLALNQHLLGQDDKALGDGWSGYFSIEEQPGDLTSPEIERQWS